MGNGYIKGVIMISVKQVSKIYKVKQQAETKNILKSLFKCEYKQVKAVENISFDINRETWLD